MSDPVDPPVDPTPEPVRWFSRIIAAATLLLTQLNPAASYFGWWHLDADGLTYALQALGAFGAAAILIGGSQVRDRVMPMTKVTKAVDAAKTEGAVAALDPSYVHPDDEAFVAAAQAQRAEANAALLATPPPS